MISWLPGAILFVGEERSEEIIHLGSCHSKGSGTEIRTMLLTPVPVSLPANPQSPNASSFWSSKKVPGSQFMYMPKLNLLDTKRPEQRYNHSIGKTIFPTLLHQTAHCCDSILYYRNGPECVTQYP